MDGEKIALGFGGNVDYEIEWDSAVFEDLINQYQIRDDEINSAAEVRDARSFVLSVLGFIRSGTGGEAYVFDNRLIEEFSKLFKYKVTIGGANTRAAIAMAKLGYSSRLHVLGRNEHFRRILPQDGTKVWAEDEDTHYPHLIVQYPKGAAINTSHVKLRAERANRLIYVNNPQKLAMKINFSFFDRMEGIEALLVSGFNQVHSRERLVEVTGQVAGALAKLPPGVRVYMEDGSYHVQEFAGIVQKAFCKYVEVYGLNEDEFGKYMGIKINLLDPAEVWSYLQKLKEIIPVPAIIVHSRYWALAYGKDAEKYRPCLRGGICLATTRFRYGDDYNVEKYRETSALPKEALGAEFSEKIQALGGNLICCEASLNVTETRVTTIGLGDTFVAGFMPGMTSLTPPDE